MEHPGFKNVQNKIEKQGYSKQDAARILASRSLHASAKAKKHNPRLNKVREIEDNSLDGGKTYTISLADKAAFLNRLKAQKIQVTSGDIVDNTLNKTFQITLHSPESVAIADQLLKQSKDIEDNPSTKLPPLAKKKLNEIIRREFKKVISEIKILPNKGIKNSLDTRSHIIDYLKNLTGFIFKIDYNDLYKTNKYGIIRRLKGSFYNNNEPQNIPDDKINELNKIFSAKKFGKYNVNLSRVKKSGDNFVDYYYIIKIYENPS